MVSKGEEKKKMTRMVNFLEKNMDNLLNTLQGGITKQIPRIDKIELLIALEYLQVAQKTIIVIDYEINLIIENNQFKEKSSKSNFRK